MIHNTLMVINCINTSHVDAAPSLMGCTTDPIKDFLISLASHQGGQRSGSATQVVTGAENNDHVSAQTPAQQPLPFIHETPHGDIHGFILQMMLAFNHC